MSKTGDIVTIKMTDDPNKSDFEYMAHRRSDTQKDMFYIGAYKGSVISDKLRSLSGKTPTGGQTIGTFRTYAQNNGKPDGNGGSGYDQSGFFQLTYRQAMYVLKYKNLDSQTAVGMGNANNSSLQNTGGTNTKGMDWGETTGKQQMKLFGIEDFWGNNWEWIDGIFCDANYNILVGTQGFNDTGSGYKNCGNGGITSAIANYMSKIQGTTELGFVPKEVSASDTTYYCDYAALRSSCIPFFGDDTNNDVWRGSGTFILSINIEASYQNPQFGARLMYV